MQTLSYTDERSNIYMYMYINIHISVYKYTYICIHIYIHVHIYMRYYLGQHKVAEGDGSDGFAEEGIEGKRSDDKVSQEVGSEDASHDL